MVVLRRSRIKTDFFCFFPFSFVTLCEKVLGLGIVEGKRQ